MGRRKKSMAGIKQIVIKLFVFLIIGSRLVGCGSSNNAQDAVSEANSNNMQRLVNLYFAYQMKHDWKGPKEEAEFKDFIRNYPLKKLIRIGIDPAEIDKLFYSERDGEFLKVRYSVLGGQGSTEPVVYEAVGINDKRMIGFLNMEQREVDEAEYEKLWGR